MSAELELARLRASLEEWRRYLAGPRGEQCIELEQIRSTSEPYNGHKHYTDWYEDHRGQVVALNAILGGEYDYPALLNHSGGRS